MTTRTPARALAIALAAMVTWSMLAGINGLARIERSDGQTMAQAAVPATRA